MNREFGNGWLGNERYCIEIAFDVKLFSKSDDLNRERHEVLNNLKALHQKEIERKRQREEVFC
jgi:hypothetical protein